MSVTRGPLRIRQRSSKYRYLVVGLEMVAETEWVVEVVRGSDPEKVVEGVLGRKPERRSDSVEK